MDRAHTRRFLDRSVFINYTSMLDETAARRAFFEFEKTVIQRRLADVGFLNPGL